MRSQRTEKREDDTPQKRPLDGQIKKAKTFQGQNREPAFKKIEYPEYKCTKCGEIIQDLSSAIADKGLPSLNFKPLSLASRYLRLYFCARIFANLAKFRVKFRQNGKF